MTSTFQPPPRGLRLIHLSDRLVLHDISFAIRQSAVSSRNALIDAANSVHTKHHTSSSSSPSPSRSSHLVDVDDFVSPGSPTFRSNRNTEKSEHRYLVVPFASESSPRDPPSPYEASSPKDAGLPSKADANSLNVDAASALLGFIPLHNAVFVILANQIKHVANLPSGFVYSISKISILPLIPSTVSITKDDKDTCTSIVKILESGYFNYSLQADLSTSYGDENDSNTSTAASSITDETSLKKFRQFQWNLPLLSRYLSASLYSWSPRCIYGFITTRRMAFSNSVNKQSSDFYLALISRRSRKRAGTRYITRGVDSMGDVANYIETEQLVWCSDNLHGDGTGIKKGTNLTSFITIRGSIPVFWRQNNGIARPIPELDAGLISSRKAFEEHFDYLRSSYGDICAVSLVNKHGAEAVLAQAFEKHMELYKKRKTFSNDNKPLPSLVAFDFHAYCAGKEYERGLSLLMNRLRKGVEHSKFHAFNERYQRLETQRGVLRVNCVDCLDRTNVVQSMVAREILLLQLQTVFKGSKLIDDQDILNGGKISSLISLFNESEDRFKHIWGDNADAISKQYSGTGALKTDFTRTGKRSTTGVIGDGVKSVMRMYYKNFVDESRQEVIDIICGNAIIRQQLSFIPSISDNPLEDRRQQQSEQLQQQRQQRLPQRLSSTSSPSSSLWYSFEAMRINAGGDKQAVFVELHDKVMYVTTMEGLCFEYPRHSLLSWSKQEELQKSNIDRRAPCRLRLVYKPSYIAPATTSPLDLQFRGGMTTRENFLRALVSWSTPENAKLINNYKDVRIRVLVGVNISGEHSIAEWGINDEFMSHDMDVVVLVVPQVHSRGRGCGLTAVPIDVDKLDNVEVISAFAISERGPAIAVLASERASRTVMSVDEAIWINNVHKQNNIPNANVNVKSNPKDSFNEQPISSGPVLKAFGGGVVGVSMEVCGTSLCFVGAKLGGMSEVYEALSELRLGKFSQEITSQFDHFIMAGLLGDDIKWGFESNTGNIGKAGRNWTQVEDGSYCYTIKDIGLSVMRNSLPAIRYDEKLSPSKSLWIENQGKNGMTSICVADGIIDGRRTPQLPKNLCSCKIVVSELRAEDIKIPQGVDGGIAGMNCSVVLQSALSTVEIATSKPTLKPTTFPEWIDEELSLPLMPSDIEDVFESVLYGQVIVPSVVIGDPIIAGCFVLSLATVPRNGEESDKYAGRFDVRCRVAGKATGRIVGKIKIEIVDDGSNGYNMESASTNEREVNTARNDAMKSMNSAASGGDVFDELGRIKSVGPRKVQTVGQMFGEYAANLRGTDVNETLGLAKKKGAKQMKSVVNRLSSFMTSSTTPVTSSSSAANDFNYRNNSNINAPSRSMNQFQNGQQPVSDEFESGVHVQPSAANIQPATSSTNQKNDVDALLMGLEDSKAQSKKGTYAPHADTVPLHVASVGGDSLLSGLAGQKRQAPNTTRDDAINRSGGGDGADGWGEFESVLTSTTKSQNKTR